MIRGKINKIGVRRSQTEAEVLKINSLVMLSLLIALAGVVWAFLYAILGYFFSALFPLTFSVCILFTLFFFNKNNNFNYLLRSKLLLILLLPFFLQISLGGFVASGAVLFWSLLAPIGALMFSTIKETSIWFTLFITLFIACLFCGEINFFDYYIVPELTSQIFLGLNIIGVTLISFYTTMFFVRGLQKEQHKNRILIKLKNEKEKEIKDSIHYAKYIQESILTNYDTIKKHFKDSFILSKPKDIVSGDFYWLHEKKDRVMLAVADSTGHGVPGAMVSLVCSNALNASVIEHGIEDPDLILNKTREIVTKAFSNKHDMSDGMDISFCNFNNEKSQLCYAGAVNPVYIIRDEKLIELKADRMPIGKYVSNETYNKQVVDIQTGDCVYMFSDGYFDQFGGDKMKKMKSSNFKKLLIKISNLSMIEQKKHLSLYFEQWKKDVEQIDDVLIVGVRV